MSRSAIIPRALAPVVLEALEEARIVAVLGPRQAGKSTLVQHLGAAGFAGRYVTLDDDEPRERAQTDPVGFLADLGAPLAIDEVQRAPQLMLALKRRVDADPAPGQYLLTGSADISTLPTVPDALPGRVDYLTLWPLAKHELEGVAPSFVPRAFDGAVPDVRDAPRGRRAYAADIVAGGYPDARTRGAAARSRFYDGLLRSATHRDAHDVWRGDPATSMRVMRALAARCSGLVNHASLARDADVDDKTLKSHLNVLEQLYLVRRHPAWFANLGKRLVKAPKGYVADTGMLCHLLGVDEQRIVDDGAIAGMTFEAFVAMELVRQVAVVDPTIAVHHYRDAHGSEVDIVLERRDGALVGIEVKAAATIGSSDFTPLRALRRLVGDRFRCGIVLHAGADTMRHGDDMWGVPISALWSAG